ncbi:betaine-aldehyde dehydrogenase [Roseovarius litoreus]|uniref:Betaine-aldehyde dehydrogenase n=1 Tax=Roseovarius litoreus TaxID=1155722 RepID=A0A1M7LLH4_9RHOB|nr:aldehyde dehydrogenase family protein [Roseovarius litoreus]SHM78991.1 betaine-aldehyde dehydrogenase [Roseovarius litoreus]
MDYSVKEYWQNYVNGKWVDGGDGGRITVMNPATAQSLAQVAKATPSDINTAVEAARAVVKSRALIAMNPIDRGRMVVRMGQLLRERKEEIARLVSIDAGKPISEAMGEVEGSAKYFEYYGGAAATIEGRYIPLGDGVSDYVVPVPMGVVAHIIPWNYPNNMIARSLAPALAAGNANVIKTPELDPLSGFVFAELAEEVGFPPGAVNILAGLGNEAGAALAEHDDIDLIVFTGSVPTGQSIMRAAVANVVPTVLELGGKSAALVFEDANIDSVVENVKAGIFENSGQVCDSMNRMVVQDKIYEDVVEAVKEMAESLSMGPGLEDYDITPLVSETQLDRVAMYAGVGEQQGARLVTGGRKAGREGYFHQPTIFADVTADMRINQEEIFGPVLSILKASDAAHAVGLANSTKYGLAAGVFTADMDRAMWCSERLEAGQIHVNEWGVGGTQTPFGGFKQSGIGREKGYESLLSYYQSKNVGIVFKN